MGLTDKHLAYGDDIPQTQAEKDYYWKIKHLEEQNNKLKEALCEKTGKWIKYSVPRDGEQHYQCTNCEWYVNFGIWGYVYTKQFKYCPNCGARMVSE